MLGRYLAEGAAGEPKPAEARSWFEQPAAQGIEEAQAISPHYTRRRCSRAKRLIPDRPRCSGHCHRDTQNL
jgi:hypothetical protein